MSDRQSTAWTGGTINFMMKGRKTNRIRDHPKDERRDVYKRQAVPSVMKNSRGCLRPTPKMQHYPPRKFQAAKSSRKKLPNPSWAKSSKNPAPLWHRLWRTQNGFRQKMNLTTANPLPMKHPIWTTCRQMCIRDSDENEVRRQRIDIYYSFVGKIDLPEE